ncbi:hypothetical protein SDC9_211701 [bioreactor metagenome]|uniref:Uncharacterized protein n=1 Tax=bioreactor metagenome TaxID=1076179 RepID=A0A645JW87_9ZZZZ
MIKDIINSDSKNFWEWWNKPLKSEMEFRPCILEVRNAATKRTRR